MSYFGTDGIRGKFGEFPIHPQFLIKLGYATGKVRMKIIVPMSSLVKIHGSLAMLLKPVCKQGLTPQGWMCIC